MPALFSFVRQLLSLRVSACNAYAGLDRARANIWNGVEEEISTRGTRAGFEHAFLVIKLGDAHDGMLLLAMAPRIQGLIASMTYELAAEAYEKAFEDAPAMDLYSLAASLHWQQACAHPAGSDFRKWFSDSAVRALGSAARTGQQCVQSGRTVGFNLAIQVLATLRALSDCASPSVEAKMRKVNALASWDGLRYEETQDITLQARQDAAQELAEILSQVAPEAASGMTAEQIQKLHNISAQPITAAMCGQEPAIAEYERWEVWEEENGSEYFSRQRLPAQNVHAIRCDC